MRRVALAASIALTCAGTAYGVKTNHPIRTDRTVRSGPDTWRVQQYDLPPHGWPHRYRCDRGTDLTDLDAISWWGDPLTQQRRPYGYRFAYNGPESALLTWERKTDRVINSGPTGVTLYLYCQL